MLAALAATWFAVLSPSPARAQGCPEGTIPVAGGGCVRDMSKGPFIEMRGKRRGGPQCPQGTHTVESAMGYRCVMGSGDGDRPAPGRDRGGRGGARRGPDGAPAAATPAAAPPPAEPPLEKVLTDDKAGKAGKAAEADAPAPARSPKDFVPFRARGLAVSLPRGWHVTDAWSDEVPTVYVELDAKRRGKPVTMLISRLAPGQTGYEPLDDALAKEKEYQGAKEGAPRHVSGLAARQTLVSGESRSAYVDAGGGAYYLLSYSAPKDVFSLYEPAFEKVLASARLSSP